MAKVETKTSTAFDVATTAEEQVHELSDYSLIVAKMLEEIDNGLMKNSPPDPAVISAVSRLAHQVADKAEAMKVTVNAIYDVACAAA